MYAMYLLVIVIVFSSRAPFISHLQRTPTSKCGPTKWLRALY